MVTCRSFDIQNHNAEISLENGYDSSKIRMVGISALIWGPVGLVKDSPDCDQRHCVVFLSKSLYPLLSTT